MKLTPIEFPRRSYFQQSITQHHPAIFQKGAISFPQTIEKFQQGSFLIRSEEAHQKLKEYHQRLGASETSLQHLEQLKDPKSLVVCTGQQCGFLTGPLFTIYKAITAIKLAQDLEKQYNVPVIPVFWNPSEDHDFFEVNHLYFPETQQKHSLQREFQRTPLELILVDSALQEWFQQFWTQLPQTEFTEEIKSWSAPLLTETIPQWFSRLLLRLFSTEGLVVFEPYILREDYTPWMVNLVEQNNALVDKLQQAEEPILSAGFSPEISQESNASLFFLLHEGMRLKGKKTPQGWLFGDQHFTSEELIEGVRQKKYLLSTNVVSRPLLQNFIFPAIIYVAGPSEGNYLLQIHTLFEQTQQPPFFLYPRVSLTILESKIQKKLEKLQQLPEEVLLGKTLSLNSKMQQEADILFEQSQKEILDQIQHLEVFCKQIDPTLPIASTREQILRSWSTLKKKIDQKISEKEGLSQTQWSQIQMHLLPHGSLQERRVNLFPFLNKYGMSWFQELKEILVLQENEPHQILHF